MAQNVHFVASPEEKEMFLRVKHAQPELTHEKIWGVELRRVYRRLLKKGLIMAPAANVAGTGRPQGF
jgi:hypothetical protein